MLTGRMLTGRKGITSLERRLARWVIASNQINQKVFQKAKNELSEVPQAEKYPFGAISREPVSWKGIPEGQ